LKQVLRKALFPMHKNFWLPSIGLAWFSSSFSGSIWKIKMNPCLTILPFYSYDTNL